MKTPTRLFVLTLFGLLGSGCLASFIPASDNPRRNIGPNTPAAERPPQDQERLQMIAAEQSQQDERMKAREERRAQERAAEQADYERRQANAAAEMKQHEEAARAQMAAEEARKAAEKVAEEKRAREDLLSEGRGSGACKPTMTEDQCYEAASVARLVSRACDAIADIRDSQATANQEMREGRKYHVVNLRVLDNAKNHAGAMEDTLDELKVEIKERRGRAFSQKECRK